MEPVCAIESTKGTKALFWGLSLPLGDLMEGAAVLPNPSNIPPPSHQVWENVEGTSITVAPFPVPTSAGTYSISNIQVGLWETLL